MEPLRYNTKIKGRNLHLPDHIAALLDAEVEVEVVLRPVKKAAASAAPDLDQVIHDIKKRMDAKYPNIARPINKKVRRIAGISSNINAKYDKYSDQEIIAMARMEKYLEKGEIIESLF